MQKAQKSWFIDIQSQKDKLIEANEQINWFPEYLKEWRFKKGIENAPDWCISRTRYWGAPMPVWTWEDGEQMVVSSREEIYEANKAYGQLEAREVEGKRVYYFKWGEYDGVEFNLHKPYIDAIKLQSPTTGQEMTRIPEVLDVWMDSGSMPYAQMHYPFENKEAMQASFPADFIAEYVGQLRAWFYVMHVLGVLLNPTNQEKPTPSFTNVITTGVVNGNDGRKMSKSFGNYPDPRMAIEKYGADPIRFYMLNSPLLSGGDMDFKEEGIMETIKGVMLPIWNTYSFFTTYANIDKWEHDRGSIYFVRHGETTTNESGKVNGGGMDTPLTEKWKEQARARGQELKNSHIEFDVIITTPKLRTKQTAEEISQIIGFDGIWDECSEFTEQDMWEYEGKDHADLKADWIKTHGNEEGWTRIYRENSKESFVQFIARVNQWLDRVKAKYPWKKILIVAHWWTGRAFGNILLGNNYESTLRLSGIHNGEGFFLPNTPIVNPLDQWILSKLQVLIGGVHDAMEGYDVSRGCRAIVDYMDELTNWYVRLSRRRFWESGMTADKQSAYETLYTVLTEVSKLLAPLMPFLSENIYQGLTGRESVHLEYITLANRHLVANDLNRDMEICEHIVSLGLALRSRKNIRVRQPLASVTITREVSDYYKQIIRDELNVKEVRYENPEHLAKKICKPDARKIGPKYGKDVQKVITEAKNGNFVEKENGIIDVGGFILEPGEYTMEYLPLEGTLDVEGGYGMVVALDTTITEDLKLEGYARDLIRLIQDMRKEADYQVTDRITLSIAWEGSEQILSQFGEMITSETLSTFWNIETPDVEKNETIDANIVITLRVVR
jgi:isoleucyl-tRNA synthetase/broad specificity phosphatase PhoE